MQTAQECFGIPGRKNPPRSSVWVDTGNNHGSTGSRIQRFSGGNLVIVGGDIQYIDDAINGSAFKVLTEGLYWAAYAAGASASAEAIGITVNENVASTGATNINSVTYAQGKRTQATAVSGSTTCVSTLLILAAGDIVRPHDSAGDLNGATTFFNIVKVSN